MNNPRLDNRKALGQKGEDVALQYLKNLGYRILDRNFRIRNGEIDLIMLDGSTLVFIEVRTKSSSFYGSPIETINYTKRKKITNVARFYLHRFYNNRDIECRFDVVGIVISNSKDIEIDHIINAFSAGE